MRRFGLISTLLLFTVYLVFGGLFLMWEFFGSYAGLGAHSDPPSKLVILGVFLITGGLTYSYLIGVFGAEAKLNRYFQFFRKWSPLLLTGFWVLCWDYLGFWFSVTIIA